MLIFIDFSFFLICFIYYCLTKVGGLDRQTDGRTVCLLVCWFVFLMLGYITVSQRLVIFFIYIFYLFSFCLFNLFFTSQKLVIFIYFFSIYLVCHLLFSQRLVVFISFLFTYFFSLLFI